MKINEVIRPSINETTTSGVATFIKGGQSPNVGTLFGGSYKPNTPFTASKKKSKKKGGNP